MLCETATLHFVKIIHFFFSPRHHCTAEETVYVYATTVYGIPCYIRRRLRGRIFQQRLEVNAYFITRVAQGIRLEEIPPLYMCVCTKYVLIHLYSDSISVTFFPCFSFARQSCYTAACVRVRTPRPCGALALPRCTRIACLYLYSVGVIKNVVISIRRC